MPMIHRRGMLPGLGAMLLALAAGRGLGKTASDAPPDDGGSLAGQLLVAASGMRDPRFRETVILMLRHEAAGALGIAINRPAGERPLAMLLAAAGESAEGVEGSIPVYLGGPVLPETGLMVHSAEYRTAATAPVGAGIAITRSTEVLRDLGHGAGPKRFLFALGYAGWAPGQLEGELARGFWVVAPGEPGLVFDAERDGLWRRATERRLRNL